MIALSPAEAARLAVFDAAPDAPESHAATIERMARAMWDADGWDPEWWGVPAYDNRDQSSYRRIAAAAYRAEHEGGAA